MNIFGIGPLEFMLILLLVVLIFGPKDLVKAGRTLGKWLRKLVNSEEWTVVRQISSELRNAPSKLMEETGLDELKEEFSEEKLKENMGLNDLEQIGKDLSTDIKDWQEDMDVTKDTAVGSQEGRSVPQASQSPETPHSEGAGS